MPNLRIFSGQHLCDVLRKSGFTEVNRRGNHVVMQKKLGDRTITVPVPDRDKIHAGTLQSIIRQSRVPVSEFEL